MPQSNGPYVNYAAICERVLREADGVLSLIRIIDQVTVTVMAAASVDLTVPPALAPPAPPIAVTFVLGLKSPDPAEAVPIKVRIDTPSEFRWPEFETTTDLPGDEQGAVIVLPMQIPVQDDGVYWFVVEIAGEIATQVPLRISKQIVTQTVSPPAS